LYICGTLFFSFVYLVYFVVKSIPQFGVCRYIIKWFPPFVYLVYFVVKSIPYFASVAALFCGVGMASGALAQGPAVVPRSPSAELSAFVLADPALLIELVAAEPDVASPVAIAWDEAERMYVAEMLDYPAATTAGRIRQLEDRDGDGRYERSTVFAERLPFPNGVMPCFGGVLVTAAPNIWYFRDRDGDGRADERRVVLTGFGEGNTQLRVNGLEWGLDNWIYVANGRSDGEIRMPDDPPGQAISIRRRDLRFRLGARPGPGTRVPVEAIAGFSQFGLAHDDWGNRFPSWNTIPIRHVVIEQQSLDRNPSLAETSSVASILDVGDGGRIYAISPAQARFNRETVAFFNASCGPIIERGGGLLEAYRGNAFVCEPLTNLVHRRALLPDGVSFIARRVEQGREFLASSDPVFRPVNLANGPDGALYLVDMYRELVEHPQFVPEAARAAVDFRRWHDRGRVWRIRPKSAARPAHRKQDMRRAGPAELVAWLEDPNFWRRMTAQRLLVERQDFDAVPLLRQAFEDRRNPVLPLHALWTLAGLGALDAALLATAVSESDARLREHALRVAAMAEPRERRRLIPTSTLVALAEDPAIRVRLQAALALGDRCALEPRALEALAKIAARDAADPWMRLAIESGLGESALSFLAPCLAIPRSPGRAELLAQASSLVGVRRREPEMAALLAMIVAPAASARPSDLADRSSLTDSLTMLAGFAAGLERSGPGLHSLIGAPPRKLKEQLGRLDLLAPAAASVAVSNQPSAERMTAALVLARCYPEQAEAVLPKMLVASEPPEIQAAAARAVAYAARPTLAARVMNLWGDLGLATRRELLVAIVGSPLLVNELLAALEQQMIAPSELDAAAREALLHLSNAALRSRAAAVLARFVPAERSSVMAKYQPALKLRADIPRGEAVFARTCEICHERQGRGHRVGPDLSGVAGRAPDALLSDILDPNREVAPDFVTIAVATQSGHLATGLLAEETATTLKLRRAQGVEETLLRSEIDQVRSTGQSLMPEGLEQGLSLQDMADLIAFLRRGSTR
jgi:putative membrane-bound dehydrogenase-like protein